MLCNVKKIKFQFTKEDELMVMIILYMHAHATFPKHYQKFHTGLQVSEDDKVNLEN